MEGAGGVGGLISMTVHQGTNAGTYFYCLDGNGNVAAVVSASNGAIAGQWEHDPFLGVLRATGPLAFLSPFLGSTKFYDWDTGLYYYGYRYYDPDSGRFLGRDPLEEFGGLNVYGVTGNDFVNQYDVLGLVGPVGAFLIDCLEQFAGSIIIEWLADSGDKTLACGLVADEIRSGKHIGCKGELVLSGKPYMNNMPDKDILDRVADCLWRKIKSKGVGNMLKKLPQGVER
jgi:RHS repeat-associated protein